MTARPQRRGFTLIELLVVMTILGLLLSLAVPRYYRSVERAREAVLRENLATLRDSLNKYYADRGRYPAALEDLVRYRYLARIPKDPVTDSASTWETVAADERGARGIADVRSGAKGAARDGTAYASW